MVWETLTYINISDSLPFPGLNFATLYAIEQGLKTGSGQWVSTTGDEYDPKVEASKYRYINFHVSFYCLGEFWSFMLKKQCYNNNTAWNTKLPQGSSCHRVSSTFTLAKVCTNFVLINKEKSESANIDELVNGCSWLPFDNHLLSDMPCTEHHLYIFLFYLSNDPMN